MPANHMPNDQELKKLLLLTAARDHESADAFQRLYKACAPLLLGIAQRVVRRREVAEEVLHDAFSAIWHSAGKFDPLATRPLAWMIAIVRNCAIDVSSSHDVSRVDSYHDTGAGNWEDDPEGMLDRLLGGSNAAGAEEDEDKRRNIQWLRDCLAELKGSERQALILAFEHGLSHGDLAAHLQKPLGTVKAWVRRGMENLRHCVESCIGAAR